MTLNRRQVLAALAAAPALILPKKSFAQTTSEVALPEIAPGPFAGTSEALKAYSIPEWFKDAKFGMWSHWGPQSAAEHGDWYARNIYIETEEQYKYHLATYGHPSKFGHKDICRMWNASKFDPDHLMSHLYAFVMGWPEKEASVPSLALGGKNAVPKFRNVSLLGHSGKMKWTQDESGFKVQLP